MMLSRIAERFYWFGRYLERAENTARLLLSYSDMVLDLPLKSRVSWYQLGDGTRPHTHFYPPHPHALHHPHPSFPPLPSSDLLRGLGSSEKSKLTVNKRIEAFSGNEGEVIFPVKTFQDEKLVELVGADIQIDAPVRFNKVVIFNAKVSNFFAKIRRRMPMDNDPLVIPPASFVVEEAGPDPGPVALDILQVIQRRMRKILCQGFRGINARMHHNEIACGKVALKVPNEA